MCFSRNNVPAAPNFCMPSYFTITMFFWLGHSSYIHPTLTSPPGTLCVPFVTHTCCSVLSALSYWLPFQLLLISNQCLCVHIEAVLVSFARLLVSMLLQCLSYSYCLPVTCFSVQNTCCHSTFLLTFGFVFQVPPCLVLIVTLNMDLANCL